MQRVPIRALGVGQTLDRSFQLYRTLFTPLFLLTLLAFGPFYIISNLLLVNVGALSFLPKFQGISDMDSFWLSRFPEEAFAGGAELWVKIVGVLLMAMLLAFVALPMHTATGVILANRAINGEEGGLAASFREAWKRYGRVLGNGILFWLICVGIYIGIMMLTGVFTMLYGGTILLSTSAAAASDAAETVSGVIFLIMYIAVSYGGIMGYYYFVIRFGFFLPPILFEGEGIGLGRSWSLTRKSFWRLLGIGIVFSVIMYAFSLTLAVVFAALGVTLSGLLAILFVFCAMVPAGLVVYTVAYRVQRVRCDGEDLIMMLARAREEQ